MSLAGIISSIQQDVTRSWPQIAITAGISAGGSYAINHFTRFSLSTPLVAAKFTAAAMLFFIAVREYDARAMPHENKEKLTTIISRAALSSLAANVAYALLNPEQGIASFLKLCTLTGGSWFLFNTIDGLAFKSLQMFYLNAPQTLAAAYMAWSISRISTRLVGLDPKTAAIFAVAAAGLRCVRMAFIPMHHRQPDYLRYLADFVIAAGLALTTKEVLHLKLPRYRALGPVYVIAMTTIYVTNRLINTQKEQSFNSGKRK